MPGKKYPAELKAAVIASVLSGMTHKEVADKHNVPIGTVKAWSVQAKRLASTPKVAAVQERLGNLICQHLEEGLLTLIEIAKSIRSPEKLKELSAAELVEVNNRYHDTVYKLADALSGPEDEYPADLSEPQEPEVIEYAPVEPE